MNIVKSLTLLASIGFFTVPAYSQILTVGANRFITFLNLQQIDLLLHDY